MPLPSSGNKHGGLNINSTYQQRRHSTLKMQHSAEAEEHRWLKNFEIRPK